MFKRSPVLKYESILEEYPNILSTAKSIMPEWYKKIPKWKNDEMFTFGVGINKTLKQCLPFMDSLSCGYIVTLPYDIYIHQNDGSPYLAWNDKVSNPPGCREAIADPNLLPFGHSPIEYTWNPCVSFEVPKGYNILIVHPLNRHDLPFTTLSGIIDGGFVTQPNGNFPFYIKEGFEGVIKQGTPIFQIIPFKKEGWKSQMTKGLIQIGLKNTKSSNLVFNGWYKNNFWTRKDYQ